ncbi:MAG TPA: glucose-6-phosphate isomerase [Gammaproteobacteria bacterium]
MEEPVSGTHKYGPHTDAWRRLKQAADAVSRQSIPDLFASNPMRFERFSAEAQGLLLDFSRQRLDETALEALLDLARETDVPGWISRMFAGGAINNTENRAALHVALRCPADRPIEVEGENVMPLVEAEREKMRQMAAALHAWELRGATGRPIDTVVNIGIGGSDLGIVMAVAALAEQKLAGLKVHCVSNIDGVALAHALAEADPETTLFVICSKTFTTLETLTNANAAREWLLENGGEAAVAAQCVAVSTNHEAMDAFGIAPDKRFTIWDWVGGRYSLWSAVGLTIALAVGPEHFDAMLSGAHHIDEHFETAMLDENLPVLLALIGIWNRNFLDIPSHAVLPYDDHLARFPAYLQQLEMESNGKSVRRNGEPVECATCPVIWGEPGSNAQHSFFQLLHQGIDVVSADFLLPAKSMVGRQAMQDLAAANCLAQSWALAGGDPAAADSGVEPPDPHRSYGGNRPSSLLLFEQLDAATLGKLIALYEHKVFVQGVIWDVNSFDQFGVELGKRLAGQLTDAVRRKGDDPVMIAGAIERLRRL